MILESENSRIEEHEKAHEQFYKNGVLELVCTSKWNLLGEVPTLLVVLNKKNLVDHIGEKEKEESENVHHWHSAGEEHDHEEDGHHSREILLVLKGSSFVKNLQLLLLLLFGVGDIILWLVWILL